MAAKALPALLLAAWAAVPTLPWPLHLPAAVERWLYNPRERTARAIEAWQQGEPERAVRPADTALRIAEDDPLVRFNAGTAHLGAGHKRRAVPLLERAAKEASPGLAPAAHYNLGNARLTAGDAAGAVEAYKAALRLDPDNAEAKFNLELALRQREKQRQPMRLPRPGQRGEQRGRKDPSNRSGAGSPAERSERQADAGEPGESRQRRGQGDTPGETGSPSPQQRAQPHSSQGLSRFEDQPEMSAQEASSLLAAVENLERQQRQADAARRARQRSARGKDW